MEKDRYTRITLRIPNDLYGQLVYEADVTSKSTNAEIVARLNDSFSSDDPSGSLRELQLIHEKDEALISALKGEIDRSREVIASQKQLISILGMYLRMTAERVPTSKNSTSNELMSIVKAMGDSFAHDRYTDAIAPLQRMVELSHELGIFNKDGTPASNHPENSKQP